MPGWFDRRPSSSPAAASRVAGCHTVSRALVESLEARVVMSATITEAPVSAAATEPFALGGNLQFQTEVTRDHALADLVKASTGFRDLEGNMASVDANGWATEDFTIPLWGHIVDPGRYTISFTGPATTAVSTVYTETGTLTNVSAPGAAVQNYVLDVPQGSADMSLRFTGTNGQVKDLKVLQPNTAPGQVWSTKYVNFIKGLDPHTIRVMDTIRSNENTTANWSERPLLTDATFNRAGVPWEHLIALANDLDTHLWVPVPARATDDYVRQLAAQLKAGLEPGLDVYVEYSNEVWNTLFDQGRYNLQQAKAEVAANPKSNLNYDKKNNEVHWAYRRNARRLKEIVDAFREVWTSTFNGTAAQPDPINNRVKAVLGGRASEDEWFDSMLKFIDANYGAPKDYFYAIGGAWYFSLNKYRDELIDGRNDLTKDQLLDAMETSVSLYEDERRFAKTAAKGEPWGLRLAAYELGVDTFGGLNTGAKADAHRDRRMTGLMERFVRAFESQGGVIAPWYTIGARAFNTNSGAWTVTDGLDNLRSPKAEAFRAIRGVSLPPLGTVPPPTPEPEPTPEPTPNPPPDPTPDPTPEPEPTPGNPPPATTFLLPGPRLWTPGGDAWDTSDLSLVPTPTVVSSLPRSSLLIALDDDDDRDADRPVTLLV